MQFVPLRPERSPTSLGPLSASSRRPAFSRSRKDARAHGERGRRAVVLLVIGAALLSAGCAGRTPRATPHVVRASEQGFDVHHFRDTVRHLHLEMLAERADTAVRIVPFTREEHIVEVDGEPGVLISFVYGAPFNTADTLAVRRRDLMPRWEVLHVGARRLRFRYRENQVHVETNDSTPLQRTHTFDLAPFAFNELEAVIRSLPLRAGYHVILPLYSEIDGKVEMDTVQVVTSAPSPERGEQREIWRVRFADPVIVQTYEIDQDTRQVRSRQVVQRQSGRRSRYVAVSQ